MLKRITAFIYGVACYVVSLGTLLYAVGFVGNYFVPKSIDSVPHSALGTTLVVNAFLLGVFALQHSVMARQWFGLANIIPPPVERSTYVLFSSLALMLLFWKWQPMGGVVWNMESWFWRLLMGATYAFGWLTIVATTFLINHFDLFGLRQVWLYLAGRPYIGVEDDALLDCAARELVLNGRRVSLSRLEFGVME